MTSQMAKPEQTSSLCETDTAAAPEPVPTNKVYDIELGDLVNLNYAGFKEGNFDSALVNYALVVIKLETTDGKDFAVLMDPSNPDRRLEDVYTRYLWKHEYWLELVAEMRPWFKETRAEDIEVSIRQFSVGNLVKVAGKIFMVEEWCNSTAFDCYSTYGIRAVVTGRVIHPNDTTGPLIIVRQQEMEFAGRGASDFTGSPLGLIELLPPFNQWLHQRLDDEPVYIGSFPDKKIIVQQDNIDPLPLQPALPLEAPTTSTKRKSSDE